MVLPTSRNLFGVFGWAALAAGSAFLLAQAYTPLKTFAPARTTQLRPSIARPTPAFHKGVRPQPSPHSLTISAEQEQRSPPPLQRRKDGREGASLRVFRGGKEAAPKLLANLYKLLWRNKRYVGLVGLGAACVFVPKLYPLPMETVVVSLAPSPTMTSTGGNKFYLIENVPGVDGVTRKVELLEKKSMTRVNCENRVKKHKKNAHRTGSKLFTTADCITPRELRQLDALNLVEESAPQAP